MNPNELKAIDYSTRNGYFLMPRKVMSDFYSGETWSIQRARLWICIRSHIYFGGGIIYINGRSHTRIPGQWITTSREIGRLSGISHQWV